jgi:dihydroneopterin aldolase
MSDRVFLEGLQFFGYHGVNPEEGVLGQRFTVDLSVHADLRAAGRADDLARTISYSTLTTYVRAVVEGPPKRLIEAVADEIATVVLEREPAVDAVTVTVRKPNAPIKGIIMDAAGVTIHRIRGNQPV